MYDLLIRNGTVIDGSGQARYRGDVAVKSGRIAAVGKVSGDAERTIDADGKIVAPGFVDSHTHYDAQVFWDPKLSPSCFHGVTTVVGGFCGFSIAPLAGKSAEYLAPMLARVEGMPLETLKQGVPWNWTSFGDYLSKFEGRIGLNAGFFVGHSAVRRAVMAERAINHWSTHDELARMKALVGESLAQGALGFSTTVSISHNDGDGNPVPSRHASRDEIVALAEVCRHHEGVNLEFLPNTDFYQETIELMTDMSLAGQCPVNWNTLSIRGSSPAEVERCRYKMSASDYAAGKGARVIALAMVTPPSLRINLASGFNFDMYPDWAPLFKLPIAQRIEKLRDANFRQFLDQRANSPEAGTWSRFANWGRYIVEEAHAEKNKAVEGKTIEQIAKERGRSTFDTLIEIASDSNLKTSFLVKGTGDDLDTYKLRARYWQDENTVVGASDAGAHLDMADTFAFSTRLLQKGVREYGVIELENAVHQITEMPAKLFGLRERGLLREGWHADIVVFDPSSVGQSDVYTRFDMPAGGARLYAEATGVDYVVVNGTVIVDKGAHTGKMPGNVLRSGKDTYSVGIPAAAKAS